MTELKEKEVQIINICLGNFLEIIKHKSTVIGMSRWLLSKPARIYDHRSILGQETLLLMFLQQKTLEYVIKFQLSKFKEHYPWWLYDLWWYQVCITFLIYFILSVTLSDLTTFGCMHICMCLRNKKANKNKILEFHLFLIIRYILNLVSQLQLEAKYRLWYSNVIKINFRKC